MDINGLTYVLGSSYMMFGNMLHGNPSHIENPETIGIAPSAIYTIAMLPEGNLPFRNQSI